MFEYLTQHIISKHFRDYANFCRKMLSVKLTYVIPVTPFDFSNHRLKLFLLY